MNFDVKRFCFVTSIFLGCAAYSLLVFIVSSNFWHNMVVTVGLTFLYTFIIQFMTQKWLRDCDFIQIAELLFIAGFLAILSNNLYYILSSENVMTAIFNAYPISLVDSVFLGTFMSLMFIISIMEYTSARVQPYKEDV